MLRIFPLLPVKDLKNVMLVCKQWMVIGEDPSLWTWALVSVKNREDIRKLNIRRLQRVQKIKVRSCHHGVSDFVQCYWKTEDLVDLFKVILEIPNVSRIDGLDCTSLSGVDTHLLTRVFNRLDKLRIGREQGQNVFLAISEVNNLKKLSVEEALDISPALFAAAISNVEDVLLFDFGISSEQVEALFEVIKEGGRPLRQLHLCSCDTQNIAPDVFGTAINKLEEVTTWNMGFSNEQITAVLSKIVDGESQLKRLMIGQLSYGQAARLDPDLVRSVWEKIGGFYWEIQGSTGYVSTGPVYASVSEVDTDHDYDSDSWNEVSEDEEAWTDEYEEELCRLMDIAIVE